MLTVHAQDALVFAAERAGRLREEAAADRLGRTSHIRRAVAAALRRAANRLDPAALIRRPAW